MGPSGSGKTTLLDVLSTRQAMGANDNFKCEGELLVNGHAVDHDTFKHIASYVPQEGIALTFVLFFLNLC